MSNSLQPRGLHLVRLLCPWGFSREEYWRRLPCLLQGIFPTQGLDSGLPHCRQILYRLSLHQVILCHPFSSCPQSLPVSGSFPVSWLFTPSSQSIGASASASALPMNIKGWFPLGLTCLSSLLSKGLSRVQHYSSKASIFQHSAFFMVQLSHPYMTTGKIIVLTVQNLCWQNDVSAVLIRCLGLS